MSRWSAREAGVLELPSGRTVRGRSSRRSTDGAAADLTLRLAAFRPDTACGQTTWITWPDFGLPTNRRAAALALLDAWTRSDGERVDVACRGGRGRTGTALACIAVIDGMDAAAAIDLVRHQYHRGAIETPWQARYVTTFDPATPLA
jgi:protein-tyrosine phosphatase